MQKDALQCLWEINAYDQSVVAPVVILNYPTQQASHCFAGAQCRRISFQGPELYGGSSSELPRLDKTHKSGEGEQPGTSLQTNLVGIPVDSKADFRTKQFVWALRELLLLLGAAVLVPRSPSPFLLWSFDHLVSGPFSSCLDARICHRFPALISLLNLDNCHEDDGLGLGLRSSKTV